MAKHTFAKTNTWFTGRTTLKRINFTKITIVNSYTSTGSEIASWDASEDTDGSVMVYVTGSGSNLEMTIVGDNGSGRIYTNNDATTMFGFVSNDYFKNVTAIDGLDILDTSGTTIMSKMFQACLSVKTLDLRNFDTSKVRYMNHMFMSNRTFGALKLEEIYGLENFDVSNVTTFLAMFSQCANLNSLNLSKWKVSSACTTLRQMFDHCEKLEYIHGISNWDISNVTDLQGIFQACKNLREIDLSGWKSNASAARLGMFNETIRLEKITVGPEFVIHTTDMDAPLSAYIEGADGYWYTIGGRPYSKDTIPSGVAATYYASPLLIRDIASVIKNGVLIDIANVIREKTGTTIRMKPSEFATEISAFEKSEQTDVEYFDIDSNGIISLKPAYRGCSVDNAYTYAISDNGVGINGSMIDKLPEKIVLPESINNMKVMGLQPGMFQNNLHIREIVFSNTINAIPERFCFEAKNLHTIKNTNHIKTLGNKSFSATRIKEALFPLLEKAGTEVFEYCPLLHTANIGNNITKIPTKFFNRCVSLSTVEGGNNVKTIGAKAFLCTYRLNSLPILSNVTRLEDRALRLSGIQHNWNEVTTNRGLYNGYDLTTPLSSSYEYANQYLGGMDYWNLDKHIEGGYTFLTNTNKEIINALDQSNPIWGDDSIGEIKRYDEETDTWGNRLYRQGCAFFAILHLHSILNSKSYTSPHIFEKELRKLNAEFLTEENDPAIKDVAKMILQELGYSVDMHEFGGGTGRYHTTDDIKLIYDSLSNGCCVYLTIGTESYVGGGHAVVLYGVRENGNVLVVDSSPCGRYVDLYDNKELFLYEKKLENLLEYCNAYLIVEPNEYNSDIFTDAKFFDIDSNGILSLKPAYRGRLASSQLSKYPKAESDMGVGVDGSLINELPERIVIPNIINGISVTGFVPGMFTYNYRVKEIVLPDSVSEIPGGFCLRARYLHSVKNTKYVERLGERAFQATRIEKALFPNLRSSDVAAFSQCVLMCAADIGDYIEELPDNFFNSCRRLFAISGGANVKKVGARSFWATMHLRNLSFIKQLTNIGDYAFFLSNMKYDWSSLTGCTFGSNSTPVADDTTDYWSGVSFTPCKNPLNSLFCQYNPAWKDLTYGTTSMKYRSGCSVFAVMHIHSALSGKTYSSPKEFEADYAENYGGNLTALPNHLGAANAILQKLGYTTEMVQYMTTAGLQKIYDALANGDYVYFTEDIPEMNGSDIDHVVTLYGINELGEVMFADSDAGGDFVDIYDSLFTYCLPIQNIASSKSDFIIVKKN